MVRKSIFTGCLFLAASFVSVSNACCFTEASGETARKVLTAINGRSSWTALQEPGKNGEVVGWRVRLGNTSTSCTVVKTECENDRAYRCVIPGDFKIQDGYDSARTRYENNLRQGFSRPVGPGVDGYDFPATRCASKIDEASYINGLIELIQK